MARPTINDVATAAGVQGRGLVRAQRPARHLATPGAGSWRRRRSSAGRRARGRGRCRISKALAVGLVVARPPEILRADAFFPSFIAGLETVLSERGHALLLQVAEHDDARGLPPAGRRRAASTVCSSPTCSVDDPRPALLEELGLPAVVVGPAPRRAARAAPVALGVDDAPGMRAAVRAPRRPRAHPHRPRVRPAAHGARPLAPRRPGPRRCATPGCPRASASRPTSPPSPAPRATAHAARPRRAADRDRLRQRPDGHGRSRRSRCPAASACPRDLSITGFDDIEISAHLQPVADHGAAPTSSPGGAPPPPGCSQLIDGARPAPPPTCRAARLVVRVLRPAPR